MKGFAVVCFVAVCQSLFSADVLTYNDSSTHFRLSCAEIDKENSANLLVMAECSYSKFSNYFNYDLNQKVQINVYPDVASHHEALGLKNTADWGVGAEWGMNIAIVSPLNPGPSHSKNDIMRILGINIAKKFIYGKFGRDCAPFWFVFGVAANQAGYVYLRSPRILPTLEELETADCAKLGKICGFECGQHFTSFIEVTYGKEKLLQLLANYSKSEAVIGISKGDLYKQWINSLRTEKL